jgi:hypothetical protein
MERYRDCPGCGRAVPAGFSACPDCGSTETRLDQGTDRPLPTSKKAVHSACFGLLALFIPIPYILGLFALSLGFDARQEIREDPQQIGDGFAQAGIFLGWANMVVSTVVVVLFFVVGQWYL